MSKSTLKLVYSRPEPAPEPIRVEWISDTLARVRSMDSYTRVPHLGIGAVLIRTVYRSSKNNKLYYTLELASEREPNRREDYYGKQY